MLSYILRAVPFSAWKPNFHQFTYWIFKVLSQAILLQGCTNLCRQETSSKDCIKSNTTEGKEREDSSAQIWPKFKEDKEIVKIVAAGARMTLKEY